MPVRPIVDTSSQLEGVIRRGVTSEDARSSADFRKIHCGRMPKWSIACIQSMVGIRKNLETTAAVWRFVVKAGCLRMERQQEVQRLRTRKLTQLRSPGSVIQMDFALEKTRYPFVREESYILSEAFVYCFDRDKDRIELYSDQLGIHLSDIAALVVVLALSSSPGESNQGVVPDEYLGLSIQEFDGFLEWVHERAYGSA